MKSYNYKYYTSTFEKIKKLNKNDKCIHFKTKHLNENKKNKAKNK